MDPQHTQICGADQEVVDDCSAPAFAALDHGNPDALLVSGRPDRDDELVGLVSLALPGDLIAASGRVLGPIDRHVSERGMSFWGPLNADWQGRVLVTPPPASAVPYSDHLRRRYESGAVSDAILVAADPPNSVWWRPFAGRPHCLLSRAALAGLPATPLTVFLFSVDPDVCERFGREFARFGYLSLEGAVSDIAAAA